MSHNGANLWKFTFEINAFIYFFKLSLGAQGFVIVFKS